MKNVIFAFGSHVDWETGVADRPDATTAIHTHCSAFVAAACKRLNIYILRPPEHDEVLLANAQYNWLATPDAVKAGWQPLTGDHCMNRRNPWPIKAL